MNETASRMDAQSHRDESPCLESSPFELDVAMRPDRAFTLTDELNRAELRQVRSRREGKSVAQVSAATLRAASYNLRPELKPVNRILERWAVGEGTGLPDDDYTPPTKSKPTPLDDETQIIVCEVINRRISVISKKLIIRWYRTPDDGAWMPRLIEKMGLARFRRAKNRDWRGRVLKDMAYLQMTENGVVLCWNLALGETRGRLEDTRHPELLRLLAVRY